MREIKFRGKTTRGEVVYGDLLRIKERAQIYDGCYHYVEPETVVQYIGVDKSGKEVYEGDILIDEFGNECRAGLFSFPVEKMTLKG